MRKALAIALSVFMFFAGFGQNFEGKITYHNTIKSKAPNVSDEQLSAMLGTTQEYYLKGGNYKSVTNGTAIMWQIYVNHDNKLYNKYAISETILWNDCSVNSDSVISIKLNKGVIEILGYKCDELILTCKSGVQKYYFNSKLGIDPKLYTDHKYSNWYDYLKQASAVPLKCMIDNGQMSYESIATEIKQMKLDDKEFQLPAGAQTAKSPF
jgi:hypothetical protein